MAERSAASVAQLHWQELIIYKTVKDCNDNTANVKQVCLNGFKCGIITSATYIHNHSVSINKTYNEVQKNKIYNSSFLYYFKKYEKKTPLMITLFKCAMFLGNIELSIMTLIRKCLHI